MHVVFDGGALHAICADTDEPGDARKTNIRFFSGGEVLYRNKLIGLVVG